MLPKSRRLSRQDFPTGSREGFVVHGSITTLRFIKKTSEKSLFSAVISKKTSKNATDRHAWKRRIYEAVRIFEKSHSILPGKYVFFAKKGAAEASLRELLGEVSSLLEQVQ